jgi:hypothetical protein
MFGLIRNMFMKPQPPVEFVYGGHGGDKEISRLKGQLEVDNAEITNLKAKLFQVRQILGKDDLTFSRFTRKEIDEMSVEGFNAVESEIDQDIIDKKIFLE